MLSTYVCEPMWLLKGLNTLAIITNSLGNLTSGDGLGSCFYIPT